MNGSTSETGRAEIGIEDVSWDEGREIQAPFRRLRKAKSSGRWLRAIRKTTQLVSTQTVLFFGLTPSSGALRFSRSSYKVARIPRPSSQKAGWSLPCRFLRSSIRSAEPCQRKAVGWYIIWNLQAWVCRNHILRWGVGDSGQVLSVLIHTLFEYG